ncbi:hypothetical protein SAMN04489712_103385 [Thermomonospora echinospora]|uniref:Uncharacterized protein n=1 Tax=Thermomonospora echinospora TaxID=1992 RepID=A0A1H5XT01_9ACTN|nr:hypothetical protein SAMN04489712_103385 [Thermomonospora echinospora]
MQPSPEAVEWGRRQAARSPRWSDAKWQQVATIFGVVLAPRQDAHQDDQAEQDQADQQHDEHQADEHQAAGRDAA